METSTFKPAWWLPSSHLQTLWPFVFRRRDIAGFRLERLELEDGDFLDLCIGPRRSGPKVVVFHGLEGSIRSHYASGIVNTLVEHDFNVVFMHFRGCSGEPNRLPRSYHSGDTGDIARVVEYLSEHGDDSVYAAIGYSLGGNALLKWLGETAQANPLDKAVAVSVPFDLSQAANRLEFGLSRLYQRHLLKALKCSYREKFSRLNTPLDVDMGDLKSFREFDDKVTAPLHGFRDVGHYYSDSSSGKYLKAIRIPTRIIHALDDPFMYPQTVPDREALSDSVELLLTKKGGHVGFVSGTPWKPVYWHEKKILEFLEA